MCSHVSYMVQKKIVISDLKNKFLGNHYPFD